MQALVIFYPVFSLVLLTFIVTLLMGYKRVQATKNKDINPHYFRLNTGYDCPQKLTQISQNYDNLLAMPNLFYLGCVIGFITNNINLGIVVLAWIYVISRYCHSYIHISSNRLKYRFPVFFFNTIVLILFWIMLGFNLLN